MEFLAKCFIQIQRTFLCVRGSVTKCKTLPHWMFVAALKRWQLLVYLILHCIYCVFGAPWLVIFPSIILTICPCPLKRTKSIENVPGKYILTLLGNIWQFFCEISKFVKAFLSNLWTKSILDTRPIAFNYWERMIYGKKILDFVSLFRRNIYGARMYKKNAATACQSDIYLTGKDVFI